MGTDLQGANMTEELPKEVDLLVIGGGISGLAAAWAAKKAGARVLLVEKGERLGGVVQTHRQEGFLAEAGPNETQLKSPEHLALIEDLGLGEEMLEANPNAKKRFIVRRGKMEAVPSSPLKMLTTRLWSVGGRLRVLQEPFIKPRAPQEDETVASFVKRRLGQEFLDYAIGPLTSGIYAGDPERLVMRHTFARVAALEAKSGSLIKGALALRKERKKSGQPRFAYRLVSFREGMETLPRRLAEKLSGNCLKGCEAERIELSSGGHWEVTLSHHDGVGSAQALALKHLRAKHLLTALPAYSTHCLPWPEGISAKLKPLAEIPYSAVATCMLGYRREQVAHPLDGFGVLVPSCEDGINVLGVLFQSTLFPGRAPDGHVALHVFLGGRLHPERVGLTEAEREALARGAVEKLLGVQGEPVFRQHFSWPRAIPQPEAGHTLCLDTINQLEKVYPQLTVTGNWRDGVGLADCLLHGYQRGQAALTRR